MTQEQIAKKIADKHIRRQAAITKLWIRAEQKNPTGFYQWFCYKYGVDPVRAGIG